MIYSSHRAYTIEEKSAMSDERIAPERIRKAIAALSRRAIQVDFAGLAQESGAVVSSLVFGAMAAAGILPLPRDRFESILKASGIAVNSNLRGFAAAFEAVTGRDAVAGAATSETATRGRENHRQSGFGFPAEVETTVGHGVARLTDYQGKAYADRYLRDLGRVLEAERGASGERSGRPVTVTTVKAV
jgi:indolepyruvate ferredoxin oxidoreductase beta subunit